MKSTKVKKGSRKIGRDARKPKNAKYTRNNQRAWNKLKRIIQSNGKAFAEQWANDNQVPGIYSRLVNK